MFRKGSGPEVTVETVTPRMAENWLKGMHRNRNLRDRQVRKYAADMASGRWHVGPPLIFNGNGQLADGQHRLNAVIEAGEPQQFVIIRHIEPEAMFAIDTGAKRTLGDFLTFRGETDCTNLAAIISYIWRWEHYGTLQPNGTQRPPSIQESIEFFEQRADEFRNAAAFARRQQRTVYMPPSVIATTYILFSAIDQTDADAFFASLSEGGPGVRPIRLLSRQLLERRARTGTRTQPYHLAALTIKAWNFWRRGQDIALLKWRAGGAAPEAYPQPE